MSAYKLRQAIPSDINFIYSTWLDSYRYDSTIGKSCPNSTFYPNYQQVIDNLLKDSDVLVACHDESPEVIFGYLVYDSDIIHYCFVKQAFRELGLAYAMWREAQFPLTFTHKTLSLEPILIKHKELKYNPFLLFQGVV